MQLAADIHNTTIITEVGVARFIFITSSKCDGVAGSKIWKVLGHTVVTATISICQQILALVAGPNKCFSSIASNTGRASGLNGEGAVIHI